MTGFSYTHMKKIRWTRAKGILRTAVSSLLALISTVHVHVEGLSVCVSQATGLVIIMGIYINVHVMWNVCWHEFVMMSLVQEGLIPDLQ